MTTSLCAATPLGQLPLLEVEGETLAQSVAIARYLARQHGLAGNTEIAAAQADMVIDSLADIMGPVAAMMRETDEQRKADMLKTFGTLICGPECTLCSSAKMSTSTSRTPLSN